MLDIGWGEFLIIGVVALVVVGPKELPGLFRTAGQFMGKARGMAREFQRSMDQAANESGFKETSDSLRALDRLNLNSATTSARKYAENLVKDAAVPGSSAALPAAVAAPAAAPVADAARGAPAEASDKAATGP